jgi:hypothetical protein
LPVMIPIDDDTYSFIAAAEHQLRPEQRQMFAVRMHTLLQNIPQPGVGDVDRALREAFKGLFDPPDLGAGASTSKWR